MTKIDLDDLERKARKSKATRSCDPATADQVLALIARIRELEAFIAAVPDAGLQADKVFREDFPGLFAATGDTCKAMYMDAARGKILERGAVLP